MFVEIKCAPCISKIKFLITPGNKEMEKIKTHINFFFSFDIHETYQPRMKPGFEHGGQSFKKKVPENQN